MDRCVKIQNGSKREIYTPVNSQICPTIKSWSALCSEKEQTTVKAKKKMLSPFNQQTQWLHLAHPKTHELVTYFTRFQDVSLAQPCEQLCIATELLKVPVANSWPRYPLLGQNKSSMVRKNNNIVLRLQVFGLFFLDGKVRINSRPIPICRIVQPSSLHRSRVHR